jgi:hypothetical protein
MAVTDPIVLRVSELNLQTTFIFTCARANALQRTVLRRLPQVVEAGCTEKVQILWGCLRQFSKKKLLLMLHTDAIEQKALQ